MQQPIKNLAGLAIAIQVAERGSFAEASRVLGLSTSAVSKAISRLEDQLGIKLFYRTTRSVSLTPDGHMYIVRIKPLFTEIVELSSSLPDDPENPSGLLRISTTIPFGRIVLAPIVAKFSELYPEVQIELILDDRVLDLTREQIDVSIRTGLLQKSPNMVARRLITDPRVICASAKYLEQHGQPTTINDLHKHRRITFKNNDTGRVEPWIFSGSQSVTTAGDVQSNTMDSVVEIVREGAGLAQVSLYQVKDAIDAGELKEVLFKYRPPELTFSVVYQSRHLLAPRIRKFIDFTVEQLAN